MRHSRYAHLVEMAVVGNDVYGLYDVRMLQRRPDAELGGHFLLILLLSFTDALWPEFLDGKNTTSVFAACLYQTNGPAGTTAKNSAPLSVLLRETGVGCFLEGQNRV